MSVDGEAIPVGDSSYDAVENNDQVIEYVRAPVALSDLLKLENAAEASGKVCDHSFPFDAGQRAEIVRFARAAMGE